MKFTPKTEKEVTEDGLLPAGIYDFECADANDKTSKAGNEMIELKLHVFDANGNPRIIFDYLLESIAYKFRHAADGCQLIDKYESGELAAIDFVGKTGKLKLGIRKSKDAAYPDKNAVQDYIKREQLANAELPPKKVAADLDDEIPF